MSQEQIQVVKNTQRLLDGPLKHVKAAALAAALLPLASVAVSPASAQTAPIYTNCSGGLAGVVWNDTNHNGIRETGEPAVNLAVVTIDGLVDDDGSGVPSSPIGYSIQTDAAGFYHFGEARIGIYKILVQIPNGTQLSPANVPPDDTVDSDGETDGHGNSVATLGIGCNTDFGFFQTAVAQVGTGTPGYWKNHPEAWPLPGITIGGVYYTKAQAIAWLDLVGKDKTTTMFSSLVSARLNVVVGNDSSCVASTIAAADLWMTKPPTGYGPVGSGVQASSLAWKLGEPLHRLMDNYNNGMLCAPHRD